MTTSIAGPYCAQILAALGADVVKVERPDTGDDGRAWGPPFWNGEGTMFLSSNAGKRSLALALRDERGREALLRLVDRADVFLQSLRPGLADELGLGADALRSRNERLVYCSLGAYGRTGPLAREPGYDALLQAAGGLISVTGEPGRPGVRVGSSLIDQGTGTWAALGVVAALLERERTGEGSVVDVSLYETAVGYVGYHVAGYLADGTVPSGDGTRFPMVAPYQVFATRDGELMLGGGNDRLFRAICAELDVPELVDDPRFATNADRVRNRDELAALLEARLRLDDTAAWQERFARRACPPHPSRTSATSPSRRRPRRSGSCSSSTTRGSPGSPSPRSRSASTASARCTRARHPTSASTRRRSSARWATPTRRSQARRRGHHAHMSHLSASFSATIRVRLADDPGAFARVATAIGDAGGSLGAIDLVRVDGATKVRDVTVDASDADHLDRIVAAVRQAQGVEVEHVSDRTFLLHLGGKLEMRSKTPIRTRDDLSMAYTPGVARICTAIAEDRGRRLEPDDQAQHRGGRERRHRGAGSRRHRPRGGDAGHGGQGGALQGVRRRRRLADLPLDEGRRRDRGRGRGDQPAASAA